MQSEKIDKIFNYFASLFGDDPKCELKYSSDIELLVAIILSAQCTDVRVNKVTKELFKKYKTVQDFANADVKELEREIYSTGFYRNKAKNIIAMAKAVKNPIFVSRSGLGVSPPLEKGEFIPRDMETLIKLPGIGRKTASVFLAEYHKIPAIAVDTHVIRVSHRLGFTKSRNPAVIERDLMAIFDRENWCKYHLYMVLFGRYHCTAKNPKCDTCLLKKKGV